MAAALLMALELRGIDAVAVYGESDERVVDVQNSDLVHTLLVAANEDELVRSMDGLTVAIEYLASEPGRLCLEAIRQERAAFENAAGIDPQLRPIKET